MADNNSVSFSKDIIYGATIVILVTLLLVSVLTSGFGVIPCASKNVTGDCNTSGTGTDIYSGIPTLSVKVGDNPIQGQSSALITWVEFSDYQCPYCSKLYLDADKQVKTNFVDNGKVKMYFRDYPLGFHANAMPAAMSARCAGEQGKFWEMHNKLFEEQATWSSSATPATVFKGYAIGFGIDATKFDSCLSANKYQSQINADEAEGQTYGVQGTPGVFLILPKAKTDFNTLKNIVSNSQGGIKLYQDTNNVIVFVGGAYPYSTFASILNTVK